MPGYGRYNERPHTETIPGPPGAPHGRGRLLGMRVPWPFVTVDVLDTRSRRRAICSQKNRIVSPSRPSLVSREKLPSKLTVWKASAVWVRPRHSTISPLQGLDMPLDTFSILVSPTFRCNADCEDPLREQDLRRDGTERFRADTSGNSPRHFLRT